MTDYFTRDGETVIGKVTNINESLGSAKTRIKTFCSRCGGRGGSDAWRHTGWTCYKCNGEGSQGYKTITVYTEEKLAKLDKIRDALRAKKAAIKEQEALEASKLLEAKKTQFVADHKQFIEDAISIQGNNVFVKDILSKFELYGTLSDKQIAAVQKSIDKASCTDDTDFVGEVKERLDLRLTVISKKSVDSTNFVGNPEKLHIVTMKDTDDNVFLVMSSAFSPEEGESLHIRGTVKEHSVFNYVKQTRLFRVKIITKDGNDEKIQY